VTVLLGFSPRRGPLGAHEEVNGVPDFGVKRAQPEVLQLQRRVVGSTTTWAVEARPVITRMRRRQECGRAFASDPFLHVHVERRCRSRQI
jgi:hypothetical protein